MRWFEVMQRYGVLKKPTLKIVNREFGTSCIPLDKGDGDIFFNYLQDKFHSLYFDGRDDDFYLFIQEIEKSRGAKVRRMSVTEGDDRFMHLHLELPNLKEIRRVIRLQGRSY